jgi:hypothetical protein
MAKSRQSREAMSKSFRDRTKTLKSLIRRKEGDVRRAFFRRDRPRFSVQKAHLRAKERLFSCKRRGVLGRD